MAKHCSKNTTSAGVQIKAVADINRFLGLSDGLSLTKHSASSIIASYDKRRFAFAMANRPSSAMEKLPIELLIHMMTLFDDFNSLPAFIQSCRTIYNAFHIKKTVIIRYILLQRVAPEVLRAATIRHRICSQPDRAFGMPHRLLNDLFMLQPTPRDTWAIQDARDMVNHQSKVDFLTNMFFKDAEVDDPSSDELYRVQRSIYCWDIHNILTRGKANVLGYDLFLVDLRPMARAEISSPIPDDSLVGVEHGLQTMDFAFADKFSAPEMEQIRCIHEYLVGCIQGQVEGLIECDIELGQELDAGSTWPVPNAGERCLAVFGLTFACDLMDPQFQDTPRWRAYVRDGLRAGPSNELLPAPTDSLVVGHFSFLQDDENEDSPIPFKDFTHQASRQVERGSSPFYEDAEPGPHLFWSRANRDRTSLEYVDLIGRTARSVYLIMMDKHRVEADPLYPDPHANFQPFHDTSQVEDLAVVQRARFIRAHLHWHGHTGPFDFPGCKRLPSEDFFLLEPALALTYHDSSRCQRCLEQVPVNS